VHLAREHFAPPRLLAAEGIVSLIDERISALQGAAWDASTPCCLRRAARKLW